ncbi:MAG: hypothetical protein EAZ40_04405, partial [Rhodobacterales bacterium]
MRPCQRRKAEAVLRALAILFCLAATAAMAQDVTTSPRPPANPMTAPAGAVEGPAGPTPEARTEAGVTAAADAPRPKARPATIAAATTAPVAGPVAAVAAPAP